MIFKTCQFCGAALDSGESCDCEYGAKPIRGETLSTKKTQEEINKRGVADVLNSLECAKARGKDAKEGTDNG